MSRRDRNDVPNGALINQRFRKCIKTLDPKRRSDRHTIGQWTAGDAFFSQTTSKSESQTSKSSKSSKSSDSNAPSIGNCGQQKASRRQKPYQSRFVKELHEKSETQIILATGDPNNGNDVDMVEDIRNDGRNVIPVRNAGGSSPPLIDDDQYMIFEATSPIRSAVPIIDSGSSPIRSLIARKPERKESVRQIVSKSLEATLDEAIQVTHKSISRSKTKNKNFEASLRSLAIDKLKAIKTSHQKLHQTNRKCQPLVLEVIRFETECANSLLHSIVLNDPNETFAENTSIVLMLNSKLISGLDQNFKYRVSLYPKWSSKIIGSRIHIYNAFNVEFDKTEQQMDSESNFTRIWTKEEKWIKT